MPDYKQARSAAGERLLTKAKLSAARHPNLPRSLNKARGAPGWIPATEEEERLLRDAAITRRIALAIANIKAKARRLLFDERGKPKDYEHFLRSYMLHNVLRPVQRDVLASGALLIRFNGSLYVYDPAVAEILIRDAKKGCYKSYRCLCMAAACILNATGSISDVHLRGYMEDILATGRSPTMKKGRGRSAAKNTWRDACIAGWFIPPLIQRGFSPTRNDATKECESACSIVSKALEEVGIHLSEKAIATVWGKRLAPSYASDGTPHVLNK